MEEGVLVSRGCWHSQRVALSSAAMWRGIGRMLGGKKKGTVAVAPVDMAESQLGGLQVDTRASSGPRPIRSAMKRYQPETESPQNDDASTSLSAASEDPERLPALASGRQVLGQQAAELPTAPADMPKAASRWACMTGKGKVERCHWPHCKWEGMAEHQAPHVAVCPWQPTGTELCCKFAPLGCKHTEPALGAAKEFPFLAGGAFGKLQTHLQSPTVPPPPRVDHEQAAAQEHLWLVCGLAERQAQQLTVLEAGRDEQMQGLQAELLAAVSATKALSSCRWAAGRASRRASWQSRWQTGRAAAGGSASAN